jgi:LPXTG-site transpeptidase (sortase) family protein
MPLYKYLKGQASVQENFPPTLPRKGNFRPAFLAKGVVSLLMVGSVLPLIYLAGLNWLWVFDFSALDLIKSSFQPATLIASKNDPKQEASFIIQNSKRVFESFSLSIPALGIKEAVVKTNVSSFSKEDYLPTLKSSLAHYKGTSLPDGPGDVFIYGHSVLPAFFDPQNYSTIFSTLDRLKAGDLVIVDWEDFQVTYKVIGSQVVSPEETGIVNKSLTGEKTLSLMTCFPPGFKSKRLVVTAKQVEKINPFVRGEVFQ